MNRVQKRLESHHVLNEQIEKNYTGQERTHTHIYIQTTEMTMKMVPQLSDKTMVRIPIWKENFKTIVIKITHRP